MTAKGCVELPVAENYLIEIKSEFEQQNSTLQEAIQTINQALKIFDQQLVTIKHEQFDMEYLVFSLVAPIPTLILQQKVMRPNDYKYFEAVLRLILNSEEYSIRHKVALTASVGASRRSISGDNEHLLKLWTSLGYFTVRDGTVYLGPKSMVEFKGFIHSEYPDIKTCDLCYNLTFLNHSCRSCEKSFHQACLERFWQSAPDSCPGCRRNWHTE